MRTQAVLPAMLCMGMASFCSDLTMPISWDACVAIGGSYTATVAATMNMMGNLAGFVMPVVGGVILQKTARQLDTPDLSDDPRRCACRTKLALP
jgi:ACS family glucarate transporter-like MFS transporter